MAIWLLCLMLLAFLVAKITAWESMCSGSGIPQVQGEIKGFFDVNWRKLLISKMIGGTFCIIGGLSLGREGPSVQLEQWPAKDLQNLQNRTRQKTLYDHVPARVWQPHLMRRSQGSYSRWKKSRKTLTHRCSSAFAGCVTSDFLSKNAFGLDPVFHFHIPDVIPLRYYGLLLLFGMILVCSEFYTVPCC